MGDMFVQQVENFKQHLIKFTSMIEIDNILSFLDIEINKTDGQFVT